MGVKEQKTAAVEERGQEKLLLEQLLGEPRIVVGILYGLAALRTVGRHRLGAVVGLLL